MFATCKEALLREALQDASDAVDTAAAGRQSGLANLIQSVVVLAKVRWMVNT